MNRFHVGKSSKNWRENWQKTLAARNLCATIDPVFAKKPRYHVLKLVDEEFVEVYSSNISFEPSDGGTGGFNLEIGTFIERKTWASDAIIFYEDRIMTFDGYKQTHDPYKHYIDFANEQDFILFRLQYEYA
jgi:hypothetical protein